MSDLRLDAIVTYGTNADRLAFTPDPAVGVNQLYEWYETDTDTTWVYDSTWHQISTPGGTGITELTGDVTAGPGSSSQAATIALNAVTNAKAAQMAALTLKGNNTGSTANALDLTVAQVNAMISVVRVATVTIPNASIIALPTTPYQLVAAPGAGFTIMPFLVTLQSDFAVAYSGFNATYVDMTVIYGGGGQLWSGYLADDSTVVTPFTNLSGFLGSTVPFRVPFTRYAEVTDVAAGWGAMVNAMTLNDNTALQLSMDNNGSGNLGGGDGANVITARTYYMIETV